MFFSKSLFFLSLQSAVLRQMGKGGAEHRQRCLRRLGGSTSMFFIYLEQPG